MNYLKKAKIQTGRKPEGQLEFGWIYIPGLLVVNKNDLDLDGARFQVFSDFFERDLALFSISALNKSGLADLGKAVFGLLGVIRVYSKIPGKPPDLSNPTVLKSGSTAFEFANKIHKDFIEKFKYARLWRKKPMEGSDLEKSAPEGGLRIPRDYQLQDGDIIEVHT